MINDPSAPMTGAHFAAFCRQMVGQPYWYGGTLNRCTTELLRRKEKQYPSHYGAERRKRYEQDIAQKKVCADCIGAAKGYAWTNGGQGVTEAIGTGSAFSVRYGGNDCPDKGADGMFEYAKARGMPNGTLDTLPETPGLAVRKPGHVGYYVGGGRVVEWRGFSTGCVETEISARDFTHWYQLPFLRYTSDGEAVEKSKPELAPGDRGAAVRALQQRLMESGYPLSRFGADGVFGEETRAALEAFQTQYGLSASGRYDEKTRLALTEAAGEKRTGVRQVIVRSETGRVNLRQGNGLSYPSVVQMEDGKRLEYVARAENGWLAVRYQNGVYWISEAFAFLED